MDQCNSEFKPQDQQSEASSKVERPPSSGSEVPCLKIAYVFAGHRRRADVREHLGNLASSNSFTLEMHEFDLMRDPKHDVLQDVMWSNLKDFFRKLQPFCVIARHFYKVSPGPRPMRGRQYPLGFPWLSLTNGKLMRGRCWQSELGSFIFWLTRLVQRSWGNFQKISGLQIQVCQHHVGKCNNFRKCWH